MKYLTNGLDHEKKRVGIDFLHYKGFSYALVAMLEAAGVKIGSLRPGLGPLGPISGHLGPRLVALESRLGARGPRLEALGLRFWALGPKVGALGSRFEALRPRFGALGQKSGALGLWSHDMRLCDQD